MSITKSKLIELICKNSNFSKEESRSTIESLLKIIKKTLESGEDLLISGFGKFCVKDKDKRRGRNPETGNDLMLDARRVVIFKCSGVLRDRINGKE
jgi:integration host factor subunit alpha